MQRRDRPRLHEVVHGALDRPLHVLRAAVVLSDAGRQLDLTLRQRDLAIEEADRARVAEELLAGRLEITRLEVLVQVLSDSTAPSFTTPRQATAEQVKMLHYQIDQSILEHRAHIARQWCVLATPPPTPPEVWGRAAGAGQHGRATLQ